MKLDAEYYIIKSLVLAIHSSTIKDLELPQQRQRTVINLQTSAMGCLPFSHSNMFTPEERTYVYFNA